MLLVSKSHPKLCQQDAWAGCNWEPVWWMWNEWVVVIQLGDNKCPVCGCHQHRRVRRWGECAWRSLVKFVRQRYQAPCRDPAHRLQTERLDATLHPPSFQGREQDVVVYCVKCSRLRLGRGQRRWNLLWQENFLSPLCGVLLSLEGGLSQWVVYFETRLVSAA